MANTYGQPGHVLPWTAPADGVASGVLVQIGQLLVVPATSVAEDEQFRGHTTGVWQMPKAASQAWTEGALVYWDADAGHATTEASGNLQIGVSTAVVAGGPDDTLAWVRLDGVARPNES